MKLDDKITASLIDDLVKNCRGVENDELLVLKCHADMIPHGSLVLAAAIVALCRRLAAREDELAALQDMLAGLEDRLAAVRNELAALREEAEQAGMERSLQA